jgi:hypothetical protein
MTPRCLDCDELQEFRMGPLCERHNGGEDWDECGYEEKEFQNA